MDFDFSDDQEMLRDTVRRWVERGYDFERRRANLKAIRSRGIELDAGWQVGPVGARVSWAHTNARVEASGTAAVLDGLRPAQTPLNQVSATLDWRRGATATSLTLTASSPPSSSFSTSAHSFKNFSGSSLITPSIPRPIHHRIWLSLLTVHANTGRPAFLAFLRSSAPTGPSRALKNMLNATFGTARNLSAHTALHVMTAIG